MNDTEKMAMTEAEQYQRLVAFLVHKAGGEMVINQGEFLGFSNEWYIESTLDVLSGNITIATRAAK